MYKKLIAVVILFLIGGAGYYYHNAGVSELIANDIERGGDRKTYGVSALEVFSGIYECAENQGCKEPTRLILQQDTTLDITAITEDGQEISLGQGTWGIANNGAVVFILQKTASSSYPTSLIANKISTLTISGFSTKKMLFPGMINPTFSRVKTNDSQSEN